MSETELSTIVISFDGREFLSECLVTLKENLRTLSHEIIVVDNGSADGSAEWIEKTHPEIRLIKNPANFGFARAVNIGIQSSSGRFLYVLNQDLRFRPGATQALLDRLKAESELGMIGPKFVGFDGTIQHSARCLLSYRHVFYEALLLSRIFPRHREFASWRMGWFDHEREMYVEQPLGSVMMIKREVIEKIGLFDERFPIFFNDVDFCRRMKVTECRALYFPSAVVEHFLGGSTRHRPVAMKIESYRSVYRYLAKYARWYELPLLWICGALLLIGVVPAAIVAMYRRKPT